MTRIVKATAGNVLVAVPNVELLEVGEDWATSTGTFTFTQEDLVACVSAQEDPGVRAAVIKLGHIDPRFDGQPAIGKAINLRLTNNGQTLIGDFAGLPAWMTTEDDNGNIVLSSAYPRRSIEGAFEFHSKTGNTWDFVLTGVALLGNAYPAITTLEDIQAIWNETPPKLIHVDEVAASSDGFFRAGKVEDMPKWRRAVKAATSVEDIRRTFYNQQKVDPNKRWWWVREVLASPLELTVDDNEGGLWKVPVIVAGNVITFGEPEAKNEPVAASTQIVAASFNDPAASGRPADASTGAIVTTQQPKEDGMQVTSEVIERLGLDSDATEEAVNAAILEKLTVAAQPVVEPDDGNPRSQPETPATDPLAQPAAQPLPETVPANEPVTPPVAVTPTPVPEGFSVIDDATLSDLKQGVAASRQLIQEREVQTRNDLLDSAIKAGKFPKARRAHYEVLLTADPQGTKTLIASLAPGIIPVEEAGTPGEVDPQVNASAYPASWGAAVSAARRGVGSRLKVVND